MNYLINPLNGPLNDVIVRLQTCVEFIGPRLLEAIQEIQELRADYGTRGKRITVHLEERPPEQRPDDIGTDKMSVAEVQNQLATVERLLDGLSYFRVLYPAAVVGQCHPTQSSGQGESGKGNDFILCDAATGQSLVLAECNDSICRNPRGNSKEWNDLGSLGVQEGVPEDGVRRFIVTSEEWASGLLNPRRRHVRWRHRYVLAATVGRGTRIIEVVQPHPVPAVRRSHRKTASKTG